MMLNQQIELRKINDSNLIQNDALRKRAARGFALISQPFLVMYDGTEAALVVLDLHEPPDKPLSIYKIYVIEKLREKGIGSKILIKIEEFALGKGYKKIVLRPKPLDKSTSAMQLTKWYQRRGYIWSNEKKNELMKEI